MKANFENIYSEIGYLFYAIASEERKLSSIDYQNLENLVAQKWQPATDGDTALKLHLVESLNNSVWVAFHNHMASKKAFELFENYYFVHKLNFGPLLREKILDTSSAIIHEFSDLFNLNGSELMKSVKQLLQRTVLSPV